MTEEVGHVVISAPDLTAATPTECPVCGYDTVYDFPAVALHPSGVTTLTPFTVCARCYAENRRTRP